MYVIIVPLFKKGFHLLQPPSETFFSWQNIVIWKKRNISTPSWQIAYQQREQ